MHNFTKIALLVLATLPAHITCEVENSAGDMRQPTYPAQPSTIRQRIYNYVTQKSSQSNHGKTSKYQLVKKTPQWQIDAEDDAVEFVDEDHSTLQEQANNNRGKGLDPIDAHSDPTSFAHADEQYLQSLQINDLKNAAADYRQQQRPNPKVQFEQKSSIGKETITQASNPELPLHQEPNINPQDSAQTGDLDVAEHPISAASMEQQSPTQTDYDKELHINMQNEGHDATPENNNIPHKVENPKPASWSDMSAQLKTYIIEQIKSIPVKKIGEFCNHLANQVIATNNIVYEKLSPATQQRLDVFIADATEQLETLVNNINTTPQQFSDWLKTFIEGVQNLVTSPSPYAQPAQLTTPQADSTTNKTPVPDLFAPHSPDSQKFGQHNLI